MRRYYKSKYVHTKRKLFILFLLGTFLFSVFILHERMKPIICSAASMEASTCAAAVINEAVAEELQRSDTASIVNLTYDEKRSVTSLTLDMVKINQIKTGITANILKKLDEEDNHTIQVPLGTLIGSEFFSGAGPKISIRLSPIGTVDTQIHSGLKQAGINQVLHEVTLSLSVKIAAILPGYSASAEIKSDYIAAQTVIVGTVPEWIGTASRKTVAQDK